MEIKSGPIYSYLSDAPLEIIYKLDDALAFEIPGIWYQPKLKNLILTGQWDGKHHFFSRSTKKFPTGLLAKVKEIICFGKDDNFIDNRFPKNFSFSEAIDRAKTLELRGIALSGIQRETILANVKAGRGRNMLATNFGKTEVVIGTALALQKKCLWLVMRKDLLYQCAERFELRTGLKAGIIGDGKREVGDLMTVAMVQSLNPKDKQFLSQFEVLMVDEAQHSKAKSWNNICMNCPAPFRFGLSGSMPKEEISAYKIMACTDYVVTGEIKNKDLIDTGWSAKPKIHVKPLTYPKNKLSYAGAYDSMIRNHKGYLEVVVNDIIEWYSKTDSILVIVDRIFQGSRISQELGGRNIKTIFINGSHDGNYRKEVLGKFKTGKLPVLIASSIINEGVDIPAIKCLILAAGGKSQGRQLQRIGRALRKKQSDNRVDIIDYVHIGNEYLEDHSTERLELYAKEGFDLNWLPEVKLS